MCYRQHTFISLPLFLWESSRKSFNSYRLKPNQCCGSGANRNLNRSLEPLGSGHCGRNHKFVSRAEESINSLPLSRSLLELKYPSLMRHIFECGRPISRRNILTCHLVQRLFACQAPLSTSLHDSRMQPVYLTKQITFVA